MVISVEHFGAFASGAVLSIAFEDLNLPTATIYTGFTVSILFKISDDFYY